MDPISKFLNRYSYKFQKGYPNLILNVLGPTGDIVSEWILKGAYIQSSNFGDHSWDTENQAMEIKMTLMPDYCILNF